MKIRVLCTLTALTLALGGAAVAQDSTQNLNQPTATQPADDPNDPDDEGQVDIDTGVGSEADAEIRSGVNADPSVEAELNDDEADTGFGADNAIDNDVDSTMDDTLPQTASPLAALALLGLGSLAGAAGLRRRK
jgi:LPXTG-motif cell wall-anchored protein